jgi:hypothetical protein
MYFDKSREKFANDSGKSTLFPSTAFRIFVSARRWCLFCVCNGCVQWHRWGGGGTASDGRVQGPAK